MDIFKCVTFLLIYFFIKNSYVKASGGFRVCLTCCVTYLNFLKEPNQEKSLNEVNFKQNHLLFCAAPFDIKLKRYKLYFWFQRRPYYEAPFRIKLKRYKLYFWFQWPPYYEAPFRIKLNEKLKYFELYVERRLVYWAPLKPKRKLFSFELYVERRLVRWAPLKPKIELIIELLIVLALCDEIKTTFSLENISTLMALLQEVLSMKENVLRKLKIKTTFE